MKGYEHAGSSTLPRRMPVILRVDGKAFHTWTRGLERPLCVPLVNGMNAAAVALCEHIQGAQMAYVQSDEISVLIHGYKRYASTPWLDNRKSKIESVGASIAAATLTAESILIHGHMKPAFFDGRADVYPESDVCNYFVWRQQDTIRNSIQMLAQSLYSQKQLHGRNCSQLQDMIHEKDRNWNDLPTWARRGRTVVREVYEIDGATRSRWVVDEDPPMFSLVREYVECFLAVEPEDEAPVPRFADPVT
jgi:tRNA(His) 5'-end guanylyltransferase